jgi:hypothetical protein
MAKAANKTSVYEIRAATSAESIFVTERAVIKIEKVGASGTRSTHSFPAAKDNSGRVFERLPGMRFRCVATGELFNVIEQAPSLRKIGV